LIINLNSVEESLGKNTYRQLIFHHPKKGKVVVLVILVVRGSSSSSSNINNNSMTIANTCAKCNHTHVWQVIDLNIKYIHYIYIYLPTSTVIRHLFFTIVSHHFIIYLLPFYFARFGALFQLFFLFLRKNLKTHELCPTGYCNTDFMCHSMVMLYLCCTHVPWIVFLFIFYMPIEHTISVYVRHFSKLVLT